MTAPQHDTPEAVEAMAHAWRAEIIRAAEPGEIVKGRAETRRLIIREYEGASA